MGGSMSCRDRSTVVIAQRTVRELGLKLERSRALVENIVMDRLEKPSAN